MLSGTLAATMQGHMLAVKPKIPGGWLIRASKGVICAGERTIKGDQGLQCHLLLFVVFKY